MSIRIKTLALTAALACAAPTVALAAPDFARPAAVEHQRQSAPAAAPAGDASRYAAREAKDRDVAKYEGGRLIVIGISGTVLIVGLIVLLLVI